MLKTENKYKRGCEVKLTVAILEKDTSAIEILHSKLENFAAEYRMGLWIKVFERPEEIEEVKVPFDILFINTEAGSIEKDTIGWIKEKRYACLFSQFVYISAYEERVFETFDTKPLAFIRKGKIEEDIDRALDGYLNKTYFFRPLMTIPEGKKRHIFTPEDVMYLHSKGHYIDIVLKDGSIKVIRGKLDDIEKEINGYGFLRAHISYLVNIAHIETVNLKEMSLSNSMTVHLSDKFRERVYERLSIYAYRRLE